MDYHQYDKNDFLEDASLLAYVKGDDPVVTRFWEDWAQQQPPNIDEFRKAVFLLRHLLSAERISVRPGTEQEVWGRISQAIDTAAATPVRTIGLRRWVAAAAVFLLLAGAGTGYYIYRYTGTQTVYAAYGTKKQIVLADASVVTLNANSSLRYARRWGKNSVREVWLDGEAYFEVQHLKKDALPLKAGERFLVHTGELDIEVLGTAFNVKDRRGITTVYLKTGAVKVGTNATGVLSIKPGEEAEYRQQEGVLTKHPGDADAAAWLDNKMVLHNTPVKEIVQVLEDTYGYKVVLTDTAVANRRINGVLPLKNTETLLYILSNMLDVDINVNKSDSTLLFRPGK
ncbi:FecR domain-containing protein [Chitinophaga oryzae]|uniref:FecR domain-containing protein n=1 Tax=Chitinophaga oryzae TaxID=2725414 RepID=A0AAE6ZHD8_9BACT|nr:FecR domain-containing protein [Chitinophaga oryzae]QJB32995.1 FecR domain-containing protein [Chitinophaga oryzae]